MNETFSKSILHWNLRLHDSKLNCGKLCPTEEELAYYRTNFNDARLNEEITYRNIEFWHYVMIFTVPISIILLFLLRWIYSGKINILN